MTVHDPRTASLLAERMVSSFFDGLNEGELLSILAGSPETDCYSPVYSMLSHTFDVFLESISLPEEEGREFFKRAVQKKLEEYRKKSGYSKQGGQ